MMWRALRNLFEENEKTVLSLLVQQFTQYPRIHHRLFGRL